MPPRKVGSLEHVEKFQGRLLTENERARREWERSDPQAGERARPSKLSPEEARRKAIEVARRNED